MANTNQQEKKELGALWKRKSKSNETYLSGVIKLNVLGIDKEIPIVGFSNKFKTQDNHPDVRIYLSEPREKPTTTSTRNTKQSVKTETKPESEDNDLI
jgi:uncharacterized protein (DUF736 family)